MVVMVVMVVGGGWWVEVVVVVPAALAHTARCVIEGVGGSRSKYRGKKWLEIRGF